MKPLAKKSKTEQKALLSILKDQLSYTDSIVIHFDEMKHFEIHDSANPYTFHHAEKVTLFAEGNGLTLYFDYDHAKQLIKAVIF